MTNRISRPGSALRARASRRLSELLILAIAAAPLYCGCAQASAEQYLATAVVTAGSNEDCHDIQASGGTMDCTQSCELAAADVMKGAVDGLPPETRPSFPDDSAATVATANAATLRREPVAVAPPIFDSIGPTGPNTLFAQKVLLLI